MQREIVDRTTRAQETLDKETGRIRELRDLERDAPNTLVELPEKIEAVEDRLPAAEATLDKLKGYAPSTLKPVAGNLEEARKGLAGARDAVIEGSDAVRDGEMARVAVATRTALEGVTGADALLKAVDQLAATIADAESRVPTEAAAADQDLADAQAALTGRPTSPQLAAQLTAAKAAIDDARRAAGTTPADPPDALRRATEAHRLATIALAAARESAAATDRLIASARSSVQTATAEIQRAEAFVERAPAGCRRHGADPARRGAAVPRPGDRPRRFGSGCRGDGGPAGRVARRGRLPAGRRRLRRLEPGRSRLGPAHRRLRWGADGGRPRRDPRRGSGRRARRWASVAGAAGAARRGAAAEAAARGGGWGGGGGFGSGGFGGGGGGGGGHSRGGHW